jgi:cellulase
MICTEGEIVVGWSVPLDGNYGFVGPQNYTSPDIICHLSATPGQAYATVAAGGTVELQWTTWPSTHHGPVITYLANCNGDCTTVDKTTLLFNKIDAAGLVNDNSNPGYWAADQLEASNNTWTVTIPSTIAPGNYVLRHEIIALHVAEAVDGAQNYPQCVNLQVTGSGTDELTSGTLGEELYTPTDPGILVNIYATLSSYLIPGPAPLNGAAMPSQTKVVAAVTTVVPPLGTPSIAGSEPVSTAIASSTDSPPTASTTGSPSIVSFYSAGAPTSTTFSTLALSPTPSQGPTFLTIYAPALSSTYTTESTSAVDSTCITPSTSTITMTATKTVTTIVACTDPCS